MQTFDAIRTRRAVKHFDPAHRLTAAEEQTLFELALTAPSAFNLQHGRLVKVDDPALRQSIREVAWNQAQVTDASLLLVLTADLASWRKHAGRIWQEAPGPVQDFMTGAIDAYYRDKPLVQRDETMRSGGILAQTLMLAARAMGYDSCPMDGFDFEKTRFSGQLAWDIAATTQKAFEEVFLEFAGEWMKKYEHLPLCVSGGCGLNVLLNSRLLER